MAGRVALGELQPIFDEIAQGSSLRTACSKKDRPTIARVLYAIQKDSTLFEHYARARTARADVLAEEVIEIADTEPDAQVARNRIDARKWYAGKVNKTFSDKQTVTIVEEPREPDLIKEQLGPVLDRLRRKGLL